MSGRALAGHWPRCAGTGTRIAIDAGVATCPTCGRNNVAIVRGKLVAHKPDGSAPTLAGLARLGPQVPVMLADDGGTFAGDVAEVRAAKPPRLSSQQARMLLSISTHGDALAHCRTSADHGGADGTLTSLHRHKLVTYLRAARKGSPSKLVLTALGRLALADHQRRTGGAALTLSGGAAPAARGRAVPVVADSPARATAERIVRRYLRAQGGDRAGFDYGDHERDLTAWIAAELHKAGAR